MPFVLFFLTIYGVRVNAKVLSEELGLHGLLEDRQGCHCSGSAQKVISPAWKRNMEIVWIVLCEGLGLGRDKGYMTSP